MQIRRQRGRKWGESPAVYAKVVLLLRGPSHHALRERGGLQAAGFGKLKHVGVQPDRAMVGELEQKRLAASPRSAGFSMAKSAPAR